MKNLKKAKKGFTLVELIVVLVILAILAAILVPALLGWIDKAKRKQAYLDINLILKAATAAYAEDYANDRSDRGSGSSSGGRQILYNGPADTDKAFTADVNALLGSDIDLAKITNIFIFRNDSDKTTVIYIEYTLNGIIYTYNSATEPHITERPSTS